MRDDLTGKVALVTGASSGLGERFARVLAENGAKVALAARRVERLQTLAQSIDDAGGRALPVAMDVTAIGSIRKAVEEVVTELGPIDILINNSGVSAPKKALEVEEEDYDFAIDTNTKGAFFVAQAVARQMVTHQVAGRIVNIASVAGLRTLGQLSVYGMSKAAVVHMTKALAAEWARYDINVNAICPGYIDTEMNHDYWQTDGGQKLMALLPRRRVGVPEDLDGLVLLLSSPNSRFINGAIIAADDGHAVA